MLKINQLKITNATSRDYEFYLEKLMDAASEHNCQVQYNLIWNITSWEQHQQNGYQLLFNISMELKILHEIREATNKCWTLGDSQFKQSVAQQLERRVEPSAKGRDQKSRKYLETVKINPVLPHWLHWF